MTHKCAARDLLARLEWSSVRMGPGGGIMGSGGGGRPVRACPECGGVDPSDEGKRNFMAEAHGHRKTCLMDTVLRGGD